jgi:UDP-N-acetylglucosamine--N-acetylmuramyl-(pentapeptide) pyrophosphoryl-undecaprenol N-acetylglucosamine transferase
VAREALRVVCYAVNGTGVGHVTRLLSIARWMRRYAAALDQRLEIWFLTSSEADGLVFAEGFAAFKIPSKTVVGETGIDRTAYRALAKQWIWHTLGLLRPDLLIVDTFPRGSFGELLGALDLCRHKAFVYRPVRPEVAARPDFQSMLPLYDLILVPETDAHVIVPAAAKGHLVHVGPVLSRERWELFPRAEARARLGVDAEKRCVFVSAGGGGDTQAEVQIERTVQELSRDPSIEVVVGAGALYRGHPFPRVTTLPGRAAAYALGFDAAVCAAGYNTFGELMFAGVPTAFLPQEKLADDQRARAEHAVAKGAASILDAGADALGVVKALLERPGASAAARSLVPENGARLAAGELLRLVCAPVHVDRVEAALDDALLASVAARHGATDLHVVSLAGRLAHGCDGELAVAVERASGLLAARDPREVRGLVDAVVRGLGVSSVVARADVCDRVIDELGALAAGDGAAARAAVATLRWGGAGDADGASLARAIRG